MGSKNKVRKSKRKKIQEVYEENLIKSLMRKRIWIGIHYLDRTF